ncbi:Chaperone protein dnaJ 49 [Heracleum sosnowskyi]|uniref:Chaperone protein dnaJ 49 n=1 Tax=Heracleum sosnowskyi TaxID=360622 RepID=A0AAD8NDT9_9APIA|nr:Chaperone protein dnaJ 49 [Heracleum sosnowskyi]
MECNRDEAERAKEIAEKKFLANDVAGAKKFAIKARSLYPRIDGISQLLATIDVFIYADNKINGEVDWYGVLGVNPLDTEDVIRKSFRKLVLMLHPDKNNASGANGAFLLVSEAWELLSDKTKRSAYDRITSLHRSQHNVQPQCASTTAAPPPAPAQNGFHNSTEGSEKKVPQDNCKKKTASNDSSKPPYGPPPSRNKQSAVPHPLTNKNQLMPLVLHLMNINPTQFLLRLINIIEVLLHVMNINPTQFLLRLINTIEVLLHFFIPQREIVHFYSIS